MGNLVLGLLSLIVVVLLVLIVVTVWCCLYVGAKSDVLMRILVNEYIEEKNCLR